MKKIAILTSGGDSPGMNAAVRACIRTAISKGMEVYGIYQGYEGLIDEKIRPLQWVDGGDILQRGGTILHSARSKRFMEDQWIDIAADNLRKRDIEGLITIGGDGTFRGALDLSRRGIHIAAIPATIDNDLGYTDATIGFDTAVNTVLDIISKIRDTSSSHERATIIEVMGRHCGDIALYAGLAGGADAILVPEIPVEIEQLIDRVRKGQQSGKSHSLIIKAEGVDIPLRELEQIIENLTGHETRSVDPCYIQRGGSPTAYDRMIAAMMSEQAVLALANSDSEQQTVCAAGVSGLSVHMVSLEEALQAERHFRKDLYELAQSLS